MGALRESELSLALWAHLTLLLFPTLCIWINDDRAAHVDAVLGKFSTYYLTNMRNERPWRVKESNFRIVFKKVNGLVTTIRDYS